MRNSKLIILLFGGGSLLPSAALAQGAAPDAQSYQIEEVVVTAQHRAESAQKAAIAISVLRPEELSTVTEAQQLTQIEPALQFSPAGTGTLMYVRGVGSFSTNAYTDPAVSVNYDGVYLARATAVTGLFYDLDRVEVLKGPQGTLYGRNATGGTLNVLPAKPVLGETEGRLQLSYGNYNAFNGQGSVNLSLSDTMAARLAFIGYEHDGYLSDGTYSEEGYGGRAQVLFEPRDTLSIRIGADYFHLGGTGAAATLIGLRNPATGAVDPVSFGDDVGQYDPRVAAIYNSPAMFFGPSGAPQGALPTKPRVDNQLYGVNAEVNADLGFANLTLIPAVRWGRVDEETLPTSFMLQSDQEDRQLSGEARLAGSTGSLDWLVGAFAISEDVEGTLRQHANVQGSSAAFSIENRSVAGFGRLTYNFSDEFRITAAARYTEDQKSFDGASESVIAICTSPTHSCPGIRRLPPIIETVPEALRQIGYIQPPGAPVYIDVAGASQVIWSPTRVAVNEKIKSDKITYRLAAEYEPRPDSLLFASYETGYRSGGFTFSSVDPSYDPETIEAFTVGSKNQFFNNRLQVNIELFHWKYDKQQLTHLSQGAGGGIEFITQNIGRSTNKGVELDVVARPWQGGTLNANVQYLNAKYDSFVFLEPDQSGTSGLPPGTLRPDTQCPSTLTGSLYTVNCSGKAALRSPKWSMNFGGSQTWPVGESLELEASVDTHYQSSSVIMFERLPGLGNQDAYWLSSAALTLRASDANWSLTAYVRNIEDNRVSGNNFYYGLNGAANGLPGPPRTYGVRVDKRF